MTLVFSCGAISGLWLFFSPRLVFVQGVANLPVHLRVWLLLRPMEKGGWASVSAVGQDCSAAATGTAASLFSLWKGLCQRGAGNLHWNQSNIAQRNLQDKIAGSLSEGLCLSPVNKADKTGIWFAVGNMNKSYCLIELSLPAEKWEFISSKFWSGYCHSCLHHSDTAFLQCISSGTTLLYLIRRFSELQWRHLTVT